MKKKQRRWIAPSIIAAVIVIVLVIVFAKIYQLMFGGGVQVSMEDVCTAIFVHVYRRLY